MIRKTSIGQTPEDLAARAAKKAALEKELAEEAAALEAAEAAAAAGEEKKGEGEEEEKKEGEEGKEGEKGEKGEEEKKKEEGAKKKGFGFLGPLFDIKLKEEPIEEAPPAPSYIDAIPSSAPLILKAFGGMFPEIPIPKHVLRMVEDINRMDMTSLTKITEAMSLIVQDGVLNKDDMPRLLELAVLVYDCVSSRSSHYFHHTRTYHIELCAELLKYLLKLYIQKGDVGIADEDKADFLLQMDKLVDSCIALMKAVQKVNVGRVIVVPKCFKA